MAWRRPGARPLSEAMMVSFLTHICVARPQWVKIPISKANMKIAFLKLHPETSELSMTQAFNRCWITQREQHNSSAANGWVQSLLPVNYALSVWGITGISFHLSGVGNNCCKVTINRCVCVCVWGGGGGGGGSVCFLAATKQLYKWYFPSVRLSVCPSVTPFWLCSHHRIIMKFSGVITNDQSKVHAKGQGQRSKVKVTEVTTQLNRFRTVTPVWIHIWWWNDAYSLMLFRRDALLFFKVIRQISRSHGSKNRRIWPRLGVSGL